MALHVIWDSAEPRLETCTSIDCPVKLSKEILSISTIELESDAVSSKKVAEYNYQGRI